jgi:hypothetical protein
LPNNIAFSDIEDHGASNETGDKTGHILEIMLVNLVVWHKSCRNSVDKIQKVARARKSNEQP